MKVLLGMAIAVGAALLGAVAFAYSGAYDVAATEPHTAPVRWVLHTTMEKSVRARAAGIEGRALDADMARRGVAHYAENCVSCHGAPGVEPGEIGKGITPKAPDLAKNAGYWSDRELFWIVKNGVRMSAMPAWGPTHTDEEIWNLVAFVRQLPNVSPEQYRAMQSEASGDGHAAQHAQRHGASGSPRSSDHGGTDAHRDSAHSH